MVALSWHPQTDSEMLVYGQLFFNAPVILLTTCKKITRETESQIHTQKTLRTKPKLNHSVRKSKVDQISEMSK